MCLCELTGLRVESLAVAAPFLCDFEFQWVVAVGCLHERDQCLNQELRVLGRDPVVLNCLSTDVASVLLDVRVVDLRQELDLRALERVLVSEVHVNVELSSFVRRLLLLIRS